MGKVCTRNCRFCNVTSGRTPCPLNPLEPQNLATAIAQMNLNYVVITSVTRDDLPDGGASHFVACIQELRKHSPQVKIEILTLDFRHQMEHALGILGQAPADVFNHNVETVPKLYSAVRPQANYQASLNLLKKHRELYPEIPTKSGLMLGLGETLVEIHSTLNDLHKHHVERLTLGQYLQPTKKHLEVDLYVTPLEFAEACQICL